MTDGNGSPQVHDQQLGFGHFFYGVAQAFAAEAGIFDAAVGHVIDAERGNVSGDHAADFELFIGLEEELRVAGEDAGLHTVGGVIGLTQGLIEIFVGLDGHDGTENFLTVYFHVGPGAGEHGGLDDEILASTAAQQARAATDGFFDPGDRADGVAFADDRANVGGLVERISGLQFLLDRLLQIGIADSSVGQKP